MSMLLTKGAAELLQEAITSLCFVHGQPIPVDKYLVLESIEIEIPGRVVIEVALHSCYDEEGEDA